MWVSTYVKRKRQVKQRQEVAKLCNLAIPLSSPRSSGSSCRHQQISHSVEIPYQVLNPAVIFTFDLPLLLAVDPAAQKAPPIESQTP